MARTKKKQSVSILNNRNIKGIIGGLVIVCLIIATITMCKGCGSSDKKVNFSEREAYRYNNALEQVAEVDLILESISNQATPEQLRQLLSKIRKLKYDYNEDGMNVTTKELCDSLKQRIVYLQTSFVESIVYVHNPFSPLTASPFESYIAFITPLIEISLLSRSTL